MSVKTIIALLMAGCLSGCAGLGAAGVVMQSLGNSMGAADQPQAYQQQTQEWANECNQGNQVACINYQNALANYREAVAEHNAAVRQQQYLQQEQTQRMLWGN